MYSFCQDLKRWHEYVKRIHSRHQQQSGWDLYTYIQSFVEKSGHKKVASLNRLQERVLEIGIGGGEHLYYEESANQNRLYVGIDLSFVYLEKAKQIRSILLLNANVASLPISGAVFDSCIACGVLEHLIDLEAAIVEMKRVLKPGGLVFIIVPTNGSPVIGLFKVLVSYPSMYRKGIKRPSYIWHHENVNHFKRIACLLEKHFVQVHAEGIPFKNLPWFMSPLWFFQCQNQ